jgi:hypothetical protein
MMMTEEDPAKIDRLASAQARLAEQERLLAGRPLPGSRRPAAEVKNRRSWGLLGPLPLLEHHRIKGRQIGD